MHRWGKTQPSSPALGDERSSGTRPACNVGVGAHPRAVNAHRRRRGYILIIVLGLTAIVTALGLAFLNSHSTVMPEAFNRYRTTRARYLAESGVDIATHFLIWPPTTVTPGDYWHGANGIAIDSSTDYADVHVQQDAVDTNQFKVTALGVAHDFNGTTVVGKHTVTAQVLRPFDGKWRIPYAYLTASPVIVPAAAQIKGDIHANNSLVGNGWCQGNVSATGTASWLGSGPPASVTSFAPMFTTPPADPALYSVYNIRGTEYTAYSFGDNHVDNNRVSILNNIDTSNNPGRVIVAKPGNFKLHYDPANTLNGTLVVNGDLQIDQSNEHRIVAVQNYPALVVTGNIYFTKGDASLAVTGSVICNGSILDNGQSNVSLSVLGSCTAGTFNLGLTDGTYIFQWDDLRSVFWDFARSGDAYPVTLLKWKEN